MPDSTPRVPHKFVRPGTAMYDNVIGCIAFHGFSRCGLPSDDPIHDEALRRQPSPAVPDFEGPFWPATGIPCPRFARTAAPGPAPELGLRLHGEAPPRITRPAPPVFPWAECSYCFGPSIYVVRLNGGPALCRDCADIAIGRGLPTRAIDPHPFVQPANAGPRPTDRCSKCGGMADAPLHQTPVRTRLAPEALDA